MPKSTTPSLYAPTTDLFWLVGRAALVTALGFGIASTLLIAWHRPVLIPIVPAAALLCFGLIFLWRRPLAHLVVVVAGFASLLAAEEGIQWHEAAFGFYYLAYVCLWTARRLLSEQRVVWSKTDVLLLLFLAYATASLGLSFIFRADFAVAFSQWIALSVLGFYFPIKEACRTDMRARNVLVAVFALLALVVVGKNAYEYFLGLTLAEHLFEIVQNRAREGERLLMLGLLGSAAFSFHAVKRKHILGLLAFACACVGGVIIGQSRTIWLATIVGTGVLFFLFDRKQRIRFLMFLGASVLLFGTIGFVLLHDIASLVVSGLGERFASIGTATTQDISLVNRFFEWRTVLHEIVKTPVVGHGFAVPYSFFDIIAQTTTEKTFVHSTYLGILHRHGLVGLGLVLAFFVTTVRYAIKLLHRHDQTSIDRSTLQACVASLAALAVAASTEGMFLSHDGLFCLIFPAAIIAGLQQRHATRSSAIRP